ncbi:MAG: sigma-54-dependent Fis family transcriptional regulator [Candidatus Kapabacteria bacterium]|jgi:transcriptional regulator with GAF, ATPase, and Fis domain|nr:sigma-54-dependent Fis family transcriptional regulator [Candidatus Kapabacteria bacterium]
MHSPTILSEEAQILASLSVAFSSVSTREDVISVLVKHLKPVFRFDAAIVGMVEPDGKRVRLFAHVFLPEMLQTDFFQRFLRKTITLKDTPFEALLSFREPFLTTPEFVAQYYDFSPFKMLRRVAGIRHVMAAPLWCGAEAVGFMNLASKTENHFQSRDAALFKALTDHAALAVRAVFANEKLRTGEREIRMQRRLQQELQRTETEEEFLRIVAESLANEIPCAFLAWSVISLTNNVRAYSFAKQPIQSWEQLPENQAMESLSPKQERTSLQEHILLGEEFAEAREQNTAFQHIHTEHGIESSIQTIFPLPGGQSGIITLGEKQPYGFAEQDWEILDRTAPQLALAWMSLQSRIELERVKNAAQFLHTSPSEQVIVPLSLSSSTTEQHNEVLPNVVGRSNAIRDVASAVRQVAPTSATVLLEGETGTGKERIARAVHALSERAAKPFVALNCAALPANLIESELFGHEKGAFTGATERRIGKFEQAQTGTIFLDEIGEMPLEVQAKLLRTLQERELERVGGKEIIRLDVRVVAATNRSLAEESAKGRFRADLYYRLNVFPITIPPLRERRDDIPLLVEHFVHRANERIGKNFTSIDNASMQALMSHSWQGNIRELENLIERSAILSTPPVLNIVGIMQTKEPLKASPHDALEAKPEKVQSKVQSMQDAEKAHILSALAETNWRVSGEKGAAALLNMKPTTLEYRMKKLGIQREKR